MIAPFIYYLAVKQSYTFTSSYDLFTFFLENFIPILFPILSVLCYAVSFSKEISDRYLAYERVRVPLIMLLRVKFTTNILITFSLVFIFIFSYFAYAFYVEPIIGLVEFDQSFFTLNNTTMEAYTSQQNTFSQLLKHGDLFFGIIYAVWVALNAAGFATLAFMLLLIMDKSFLALSLPVVIYLVQSFLAGVFQMVKFQFSQAIFPFSYMQLPLWTALVPFALLLLLLAGLIMYAKLNIHRLDRLL